VCSRDFTSGHAFEGHGGTLNPLNAIMKNAQEKDIVFGIFGGGHSIYYGDKIEFYIDVYYGCPLGAPPCADSHGGWTKPFTAN
jgi:hypothetical protein